MIWYFVTGPSQKHVFKISPCYSMLLYFIPFCDRIILCYVNTAHFVIHLCTNRRLGCFHLLPIVISTTVTIHMQAFV